jgi:2-hydroxychromene-2-carboxylate isomerase
MSAPIDFWFSIGSTYTYLSVMRVADIERQNGITFRWRCRADWSERGVVSAVRESRLQEVVC